jgi:hypothetical protein
MKSSPILARSARTLIQSSHIRAIVSPKRPSLIAFLRQYQTQPHPQSRLSPALQRSFSTSQVTYKGLQPDSADPKAPNPTAHHATSHAAEPASISDEEYHALSNSYIDSLLRSLEEMAEDPKKGLEVEYSVRDLFPIPSPLPLLTQLRPVSSLSTRPPAPT